jgi:uncharacterized protein with GYD domain
MPHYLIKANYGPQGVAGLSASGGTSRREIVGEMIEGAGGTVESFYFAFGDADVYVTTELPDNETAAALALSINQSGATMISTVVLMTPEQMDKAADMAVDYRQPGS